MLKDTPLSETELMSRYKVMVLMVKNKNGDAKQADADTVLRPDDIIMVLGRRKSIREVFERVAAQDAGSRSKDRQKEEENRK